ncbi:MAG: sulfatase-modifying factor 1 [Myxococcaceae bacterium]|nr:sulfatase-modifying factor 1 [Myxococcaceae bacterium]
MDVQPDSQAWTRKRGRARAAVLAFVACSVCMAGYALAAQRADRPHPAVPALCHDYAGLPPGFGTDPHAGMVKLPGGRFVLGSDQGYADERPPRERSVQPFWIDRTEVTNAQFAAFVAATGYITSAERDRGAAVFHPPTAAELAEERYAFWRYTPGANYRHPEGPDSQIAERANQPVVQVSYRDASAYAAWLGRELPTEAEWEYAARAGRDDAALHKAPRDASGHALANFWQGDFPLHNSQDDGFVTQAPVGCFAANAFGLYDTIGNVWEWTSDLYRGQHEEAPVAGAPTDCRASAVAEPSEREARVIKGGSFLCSANFCARYRVSARHPQESDLPAQHIGFRTVRREP